MSNGKQSAESEALSKQVNNKHMQTIFFFVFVCVCFYRCLRKPASIVTKNNWVYQADLLPELMGHSDNWRRGIHSRHWWMEFTLLLVEEQGSQCALWVWGNTQDEVVNSTEGFTAQLLFLHWRFTLNRIIQFPSFFVITSVWMFCHLSLWSC